MILKFLHVYEIYCAVQIGNNQFFLFNVAVSNIRTFCRWDCKCRAKSNVLTRFAGFSMKPDNDRPNSNGTSQFFFFFFFLWKFPSITALSPQSEAVNLRALSCCAAKTKITGSNRTLCTACPLREIFLSLLESFCRWCP